MKEQETHPLFNPNITWVSIGQMEENRRKAIEQQQAKREEGYRKKVADKPSHLLSEKDAQ